ncbi:MAG: c-type cytochrome [Verrucomicrobia bacterium]|nr:c-type cytochrome [Verrucomicrobiota bacterium]
MICVCSLSISAALLSGPALYLERGERIALVGNSLAERMGLYGHFETLLHSRFPDLELVVRNFGWPCDEVGNQQRPNDYTKLGDPLRVFGPDTFICFFGYNESFAGPAGVERFKADFEKWIADSGKKYAKDSRPPRFVLVSPIAFESTGDPLQPDGKEANENLELYTRATAEVAQKLNLPSVDLFTPTAKLFAEQPGLQFTVNAVHLNEHGDRVVATILDRALFGSVNPASIRSPQFEQLRAAVIDKAWIHFNDYRMVNGWYVYGGRRAPYDALTFPREYKKIRQMAAVRDRYVWDLAQGKLVPSQPDDSQTMQLTVPLTSFGTKAYSEPKELRYLSPDEAVKALTLAPGYAVNLFASESEFPELAKPVQLNFDGQGRLWVACMPAYPQWRPGDPKPDDKLLILEDTDGDGGADKCELFADGLNLPTGFEFFNGGVLVTSQPRLLFLKDTDGDDRADVRIEWLDGFATDDTHQACHAFEWTPGGELCVLEGLMMSTAVETPWGPFRNQNASVCYKLDPKTLRLDINITPCFVNPWCYVSDRWGQGFVGEATGAQQYWATPLSGAPFNGRKGCRPLIQPKFRPVLGCEIVSSRHFPDEAQGNYLLANVLGFNGIGQFKIREEGSGYAAEKAEPLVESSDKNFRPGDPQFGPDGALYFVDWHNALIGHAQYSMRDPNRDHTHGRIYRITAKGRPLLKTPPVEGKPVMFVLEQLKAYEARTAYRARRELRARDPNQLLPAVNKWVAALDKTDPDYERHLCEALWVQQGHHAVEVALLGRVLRAKDYHARAAATHVLTDEWSRVPNPMALLQPQVSDEHPRVRLEAVRALSFVKSLDAVELALEAVKYPLDYYLQYTLESTLGALEPVWKDALAKGALAASNPEGLDFITSFSGGGVPSGAVLNTLPPLLSRLGPDAEEKRRSYAALAEARGTAEVGQEVFGRICISCHKIGNEGAEFGPDLTKVASRLKREEIIESIIDPNAKIDPRYLAMNVTTKDGEEYSGVVGAEDERTLTLVMGLGQKQVIEKSNIKERATLKASSMPEGLPQTMSAQEFVDLVEFLVAQK